MEVSVEGFDTGIMKQLSIIEEKCSPGTSQTMNPICGNLDEFRIGFMSREELLKNFHLDVESSEEAELSFEEFLKDLGEIRRALEGINTQIGIKKSQQIASENRIERLIQDVVGHEGLIEEVDQGLLSLELKEKDFGVAFECFDKVFGQMEKVVEFNRAMGERAGLMEQKVKRLSEKVMGTVTGKSKEEEKLILTLKTGRNKGGRVF